MVATADLFYRGGGVGAGAVATLELEDRLSGENFR